MKAIQSLDALVREWPCYRWPNDTGPSRAGPGRLLLVHEIVPQFGSLSQHYNSTESLMYPAQQQYSQSVRSW